MRLSAWLLCTTGLLAPAAASRADVKPNPLFTDNMVFQQNAPLPVWGTAEPGENVTVSLSVQGEGAQAQTAVSVAADDKGKWMVTLGALKAAPKLVVSLKIAGKNTVEIKNIAVGEVWICSGQSNMQWAVSQSTGAADAAKAPENPDLRLFYVPRETAMEPVTTVKARWEVANPKTVPGFSAVAYYFGLDLQKTLKVPVGLIHTSWGGTPAEAWTSKATLENDSILKHYINSYDNVDKARKAFDPAKAKADYEAAMVKHKEAVEKAKADSKPAPKAPQMAQMPGSGPNTPTVLYNGMIAPLIPYAFKGAIWYQGESNAGRAWEYRTLFPAMITDWRKAWKSDFPFLFVQLAPYQTAAKEPGNHNWGELREAQLYTQQTLKGTGMAVITDAGEADIHPKAKKPVGERLAWIARANVYGEKIEPYGPIYKSKKVEGNKVVLSFDHLGGGLAAKGDKLTGFSVCGADGKFVWADAAIEGDTVVVTSDKVAAPTEVRFGWAVFPVVNLFNKAGQPATPFRTDTFPVTTQPKK